MAAGPAMTALALALAAGFPDHTAVRLRAVDARTGIGLPARVFLSCCQGQETSAPLPPQGASVALSPALHRVRMEAGGYRPLEAAFELAPGVELEVTFEMDPISPPDVLDVSARPLTGASVLHGFVIDAETARRVAGADVALPQMDRRTATDETGYFRFTLPATGDDRPLRTTLRITAPAHAPHEVAGLLIAPGATFLREVLSRGERPTTRDDTPRALLAAEANDAPPGGAPADAPDEPGRVSAGPARLVALDPPASIRLGITARAGNRAGVTHAHVLLGASLRRGGQVVSDPLHDALVALPPGDSDLFRAFWVRRSVGPGTYDLLVSLYDDVDEDGVIANGIDLPLQLLVLPAAVEVCAGRVSAGKPNL